MTSEAKNTLQHKLSEESHVDNRFFLKVLTRPSLLKATSHMSEATQTQTEIPENFHCTFFNNKSTVPYPSR